MPAARSIGMALHLWRRRLLGASRSAFPRAHVWLRGLVDRLRGRPRRDDSAIEQVIGTAVTIDGIQVRLAEQLSLRTLRIIATGRHEQQERRLVRRVLRADDVVMDVGAGIGLLSIMCAQVTGSERVFGYEANPALEPLANENYALNGVSPHLTIGALGRTEGELVLHVAEDFWGASVHSRGDATHAVTVPVKPFAAEIARTHATFLIVDIEGAETELFAGADLSTVRKIAVEIHPHITGWRAANAVRRRLRNDGFAEVRRDGLCYLYVRP